VNGIFLAKKSGWIVRMVSGGCDAQSVSIAICWPVALFEKLKLLRHFW